MAEPKSIYALGGTVQASGGVYIERAADTELLQMCRDSKLGFILSSRQVGKSSLMMHTAQQLEQEGIRSAIVDLSAIGVNVTVEQWYVGILTEVANSLGLQTDIFPWWEKQGKLGPAQRLSNFFRDVVLKEIKGSVILFFDEIDSTLSIAEKLGTSVSDDFFAALRAVYNARPTTADFERLSFVLIGVASPSELISDIRRTPFNIGQRVEVTDFTLAEAQPLAAGLKYAPSRSLEWVFEWTNGHPYLTQRLCAALAQQTKQLTRDLIADVVQDIFMGESGQQDNNLQFVRDMLLKRATAPVQEVLSIYEQVLNDKKIEDDERSTSKVHLKLAGVVRRTPSNLLQVSNQIYARVFNLQWVEEHLTSLRSQSPLQSRALDWEQTNRDSSFLLRGKELADAEQLLLRDQLPEVRGKRIVQEFVLSSKRDEERLREEQERKRKAQERLRNLALIVLLIVAVTVGVLANVAWQASTNARNAETTAVVGAKTLEYAVTSQIMALQTSNADSTRVANAEATSRALQGTATINAISAALAQEVINSLSKSLAVNAQPRMEINYIQGLLLGVQSFRLLENSDISERQYPDAIPALLNDMPRGLVRNLEFSSGSVRKIIYTPSGNLMISMSDTVDLWDTKDPASPMLVTGWESTNTGLPNDVAFSPNNKLMVIGYQDGQVEIWSVSVPNVVTNLATWNAFSSPVKVSVSPDNTVLAVAGDRTIKFWDIGNPRSPQPKGGIAHPHEISDKGVDVNYLGFAPGSTAPLLLSGGMDAYLRFWNLGKYNYNPSESIGNPFEFDTDTPHVAISDKFLIIADKKLIRVFYYSNNGREHAGSYPYVQIHQGVIEGLVISPDNENLYTIAKNGVIAEWDLKDPRHMKFTQTFAGPMQNVRSLALHTGGDFLAVAGNNSTLAIWDLSKRNTAPLWRSEILHEAEITDVAYNPDLNLLALGDTEGGIVLWDVTNPSIVKERRSTDIRNPIRHIAFSPDNMSLLFFGDSSNDSYSPAVFRRDLTRLDVSENEDLFATNTADIFAVGNNYVLAGEGRNGTRSILSWDISTRPAFKGTVPLSSTECPFFDTARNGDLVAVATCQVQLWEFSEDHLPTLINTFDSADSSGVAFNADGTLITSANENSTISIWRRNADAGFETLPPISAHAGPVTSVAISPDGKTLASGGEDQDIILWDLTNPESVSQRVVLKGHTSAILNGGIFFLPDGKTLISASEDEVILWDLDPQSWIDKACRLAGRNFNASEWGQFVGQSILYGETCPGLPVPGN